MYFAYLHSLHPGQKFKTCCSSQQAFAAIGEDDKVVTWSINSKKAATVISPSRATSLMSNYLFFVVLFENGEVVIWKHENYANHTYIQYEHKIIQVLSTGKRKCCFQPYDWRRT